MIENFRLNPRNIDLVLGRAPDRYGAIRFDPNDDCNVHCVYCHNVRSSALVAPTQLEAFLRDSVLTLDQFHFGCGMEPTLDPRLCEFFDVVARAPAFPKHRLQLQTNGILLHRHDAGRLVAAGLTHLSVSVDAPHADTHKSLRGGTSLAKVERNLRRFRQECPGVRMIFLTTVTSENLGSLRDLVVWGCDIGAQEFVFRQMFHDPSRATVDPERMPVLLVSAERFDAARSALICEFGNVARLHFMESAAIVAGAARAEAASI